LTVVIAALTLIATIRGWWVTHNKQKEILEITRQYAVADRELAAFREKIDDIFNVIESLTNLRTNLIAIRIALEIDPEWDKLDELLGKFDEIIPSVASSLGHPSFKSLIKSLPPETSTHYTSLNRISKQLTEASTVWSQGEMTIESIDETIPVLDETIAPISSLVVEAEKELAN